MLRTCAGTGCVREAATADAGSAAPSDRARARDGTAADQAAAPGPTGRAAAASATIAARAGSVFACACAEAATAGAGNAAPSDLRAGIRAGSGDGATLRGADGATTGGASPCATARASRRVGTAVVLVALVACAKTSEQAPAAVDVTPEQRARGAALVGELKKSLLGAVTGAMGRGVPAAIETCHTEAPALTAAVARAGAVVGRATDRPRNPSNEATGWQAEALAHFARLKTAGTALAGQQFARVLPDGRVAYAEPLVIQELCLACHGQALAPEVEAALAAKYPTDRARGYAAGDLRGVAWAELPAAAPATN